MTIRAGTRLDRLSEYLRADPGNLPLLADAAGAAADERNWSAAADYLQRYAAMATLTPALRNLAGTVALAQGEFEQAVERFSSLIAAGDVAPAVKFNLAWAHAMLGEFSAVPPLMDDDTVAVSPRAPALKIEALHHLGRYDQALAEGERLSIRFPDNEPLAGALSVLAMDADRPDLAQLYAARSGADTAGLGTRALLLLDAGDAQEAFRLADRALRHAPNDARAWIGRGLARLNAGEAGAADDLTKGAELFGDHVGSWIAVGWARFTEGRYEASRAAFERAVAIDGGFAEGHGGLAVLDIVGGDLGSAARKAETARRLDPLTLGAALATMMLLETEGKQQAAAKLRERALNQPLGPGGSTIAQAIAALARSRPRRG